MELLGILSQYVEPKKFQYSKKGLEMEPQINGHLLEMSLTATN